MLNNKEFEILETESLNLILLYL